MTRDACGGVVSWWCPPAAGGHDPTDKVSLVGGFGGEFFSSRRDKTARAGQGTTTPGPGRGGGKKEDEMKTNGIGTCALLKGASFFDLKNSVSRHYKKESIFRQCFATCTNRVTTSPVSVHVLDFSSTWCKVSDANYLNWSGIYLLL